MDGIGVPAEVGTIGRPGNGNGNGHEGPSLAPVLERVQRTCELASQHGTQLSVVVAGLDGFRMVNDCLGPIEGDAVLSAFAACVGDNVEQVAHLGGDQLIGILPATEAATAVVLAEGLREDVARGILTAMGKLTASFGVAVYPAIAETARELVYGAQAAMYWAKAMGGNRVGCCGEAISRGARIFAVADAFDAITSDRPYRDARSHIVAVEEIMANSGSQFDPQVVESLLRVLGYERSTAPGAVASGVA